MSPSMRWSMVWILGYGSTVLVLTGCSGGWSSMTTDASTTDSTSTSTSGPVDDTRGTSSSDATGVSFLPEPDAGVDALECDIFAQDCPPGERCTFWAEDGGHDPTTTRCVPLADAPAGVDEPCHTEGTFGVDDCGPGLICLDVDPETQEGVCVPLCVGGPDHLYCEDPDRFCQVGSDGWIILCRRICNPLLQDCLEGQGCYPLQGTWACIYDASDGAGAHGDSCMPGIFASDCAPSLVCVPCEGSSACCTELCHLTDPAGDQQCTAAAAGAQCLPYYDAGVVPAGYENVGVCTLP